MNLDEAIADAERIYDEAITAHFAKHRLAGVIIQFSGGNDSTILAHLMRDKATHFGHANTGIGVEQTREFVRHWSAEWGLPLLEFSPNPEDSFETQVVERGFPGPAHHWKMYQRLKERQFRKMRRVVVNHPTRERVMFIAGRRRAESDRREDIPEHEREGSTVWVSPLANWSPENMTAYRAAHPDMPRNEVSDMLHMSGECLCGSFAGQGEIEQIDFFFPEVGGYIHDLEQRALDNGVDPERCRYGWGAYRSWPADMRPKVGRACSTCSLRFPGTPVALSDKLKEG